MPHQGWDNPLVGQKCNTIKPHRPPVATTNEGALLTDAPGGISRKSCHSEPGWCLEGIATVNGALAEHQADIETLGTEKVSTTTEVIAGAGLTGGGTLGTSRTLNVAATNDSVVVADDNVVNTYNGLDSTSTTRPLSAAPQGKALDGAMVHKTGNESIDGIKTFTSSPVVPTPTTDYQAATKAYADSLVVGLLDYRGGFDASVNAYPSSGRFGNGALS